MPMIITGNNIFDDIDGVNLDKVRFNNKAIRHVTCAIVITDDSEILEVTHHNNEDIHVSPSGDDTQLCLAIVIIRLELQTISHQPLLMIHILEISVRIVQFEVVWLLVSSTQTLLIDNDTVDKETNLIQRIDN